MLTKPTREFSGPPSGRGGTAAEPGGPGVWGRSPQRDKPGGPGVWGRSPQRIVVSGGTGFVGARLVAALLARGDDVLLLVRPSSDLSNVDPRARHTTSVADAAAADGVINLAGAGVLDERWSVERLRVIEASRVDTTAALVRAARNARAFVSASAVGYYGMRLDDAERDESSPPGDDTLARICLAWEAATEGASGRLAIARIGIVLGRDGGALGRMVPLYRRFVGGPIGSGTQWWSWVHIDDVVAGLLFALDQAVDGPFNLTAERPATMNEVASTLARVLHRPNAFRVPAAALRLALGPGAEVLVTGQRVVPKKLLASGFRFRYGDLESALRAVT